MADWLVAKINPLLEHRAVRQVKRAGAMGFCPRYYDKQVKRERPLYPSYMFVLSPNSWYYLFSLDSIVGVVIGRSDRIPFRSKGLDKAVEKMIDMSDPSGNIPAPIVVRKSKFLRGDRVRVLNGIFTDCRGVFDQFCDGKSRIRLDLLGATITLNESELAPMGAAER